ncbi:MAG: helix-turn-helix domain-containing protein [Gammaproteobacteria bacterium]|nr:helix-turn-helix domain-containing protein [Gammaproteobacteria bacterium]
MNRDNSYIFFLRFITCSILMLFVNVSHCYNAQKRTIDSIFNRSFEYLEDKIFEFPNDETKSVNYGHIYLKKAKIEKNLNRIADGYYFLSLIVDDKNSRKYLDSLSRFSEEFRLNKKLAVARQGIGKLLFENGDIQGALDHYLMAIKVLDKSEQSVLYQVLTHNIGLIKGLIGQNKEALKVYQEYLYHIKKNGINEDEINNYLVNLFSLSHSFTENKLLDSATYYNRIGILESIKYSRPRHYAKFVLGEGYNLFYKKDYNRSLDSLRKSVPLILRSNDKMNAAIGYLYIGKIQLIQHPLQNPISLLKADSLIAEESRYYPELVEIYELLYDYYKNIEDSDSQLHYLEKLINYDRILRQKYSSLYYTITKEYDQPKLLQEKEDIIDKLEEANTKKVKGIATLVFVILLLVSLSLYYYNKRQTYKIRFEQLLKDGMVTNPITSKPKVMANLPDKIVAKILARIELFEKERRFLDNNLSLTSMAKSIETNSNYLSRIINQYKGKNYSSYINDLRISYVVQELKNNQIWRQYTIKAIAFEIGYKNAESFTNAFHQRLGIYPSYFIRELNKKDNEV